MNPFIYSSNRYNQHTVSNADLGLNQHTQQIFLSENPNVIENLKTCCLDTYVKKNPIISVLILIKGLSLRFCDFKRILLLKFIVLR